MGKAARGGAAQDFQAPSLAEPLSNLCCLQELQHFYQPLYSRAAVVPNRRSHLKQLMSAQASTPSVAPRSQVVSAASSIEARGSKLGLQSSELVDIHCHKADL